MLGCVLLPGGWICTAMELLPESEWRHYDVRTASEAEAPMVRVAYAVAFERGGYVHGDLRLGNILVRHDAGASVPVPVAHSTKASAGAALSDLTGSSDKSSSAAAATDAAAESAHAGSLHLHDLVARSPVQFVDFDWAGRVGAVCYPVTLNTDPAAGWLRMGTDDPRGEVIQSAHDMAMITPDDGAASGAPPSKRARSDC